MFSGIFPGEVGKGGLQPSTFRTTHSSVIEQGTLDRISVVGRTSTGRIYEFVREIDGGQVISETWTDLSWEPRFVVQRLP